MTSSVCVVADGLHLVEPDLLAGVEDERVLRGEGVDDVICRVLRGVDDVIFLVLRGGYDVICRVLRRGVYDVICLCCS
jgi:hypothetical protein